MKAAPLELVLLLLLLFALSRLSRAQDEWQQHIDYKIDVQLDDSSHTLHGELNLTYHNRSPDTLRKLILHLWPNAYRSKKTPLMEQRIERMGRKHLAFLSEEDRGWMDSLSFKVGGKKVSVRYQKHRTIAVLELENGIEPASTREVSTSFRTRLPGVRGRMGHHGQAYRVAYWYPFPAVYDEDGWHPMTLMHYGEGYHEFGDYEVSIELPANYRVAATGVLQNEAEREWLNGLAERTAERDSFSRDRSFPPSSEDSKTLRYKAENVVDFAWFADKRYHVLKDTVELPHSGRTVTTWSLFPGYRGRYWQKSPGYIEAALQSYSKVLGDYPYPQATAAYVPGSPSMEFPMVTETSLSAIVHELGHNWFYGVLATDQRRHAWLDEGLNTYLEERVQSEAMQEELPRALPRSEPLPLLEKGEDGDVNTPALDRAIVYNRSRTGLHLQQRLHLDRPPELLSTRYASVANYAINSYSRTAMQLEYLENYIGKDKFDALLMDYYGEWKFRHPEPTDFFEHLRKADEPVDWFTQDYIRKGAEVDLAIVDREEDTTVEGKGETYHRLRVENRGESRAPFYIGAIKDGKVLDTVWYDGFEGVRTVRFPSGDYELYRIDPFFLNGENDRKDNDFRLHSAFPNCQPLHFDPLMSFNRHDRSEITYSPAVGWNNYDKTMLGAALYNGALFPRDLEYVVIPMYGTGSGKLTGLARLAYNGYWDESGVIDRIRFEINGKRFTEAYRKLREGNSRDPITYSRIMPKLSLHLESPSSDPSLEQSVTLRSMNLLKSPQRDIPLMERIREMPGNDRRIDELSYRIKGKHMDGGYRGEIAFQQGEIFKKAQASFAYRDRYRLWSTPKRVDVRFFGGMALGSDDLPSDVAFRLNAFSGREDYMYDHLYLDRGGKDPVFGQQIAEEGGGFKSRRALGVSEEWLVSVNLESDLPIVPKYIRAFADVGTTPGRIAEESPPLIYNAGLSFVLPFRNEWVEEPPVEIHFPLLRSKGTSAPLDFSSGGYFRHVTFTLRFHQADILPVLREKGVSLFR